MGSYPPKPPLLRLRLLLLLRMRKRKRKRRSSCLRKRQRTCKSSCASAFFHASAFFMQALSFTHALPCTQALSFTLVLEQEQRHRQAQQEQRLALSAARANLRRKSYSRVWNRFPRNSLPKKARGGCRARQGLETGEEWRCCFSRAGWPLQSAAEGDAAHTRPVWSGDARSRLWLHRSF
jgi:hypothetical protein